MKSFILLSFFPESITQEKIIEESIISIKKLNLPIVLISHTPVRKEIQGLVDYFIFDKENRMIGAEEYLKSPLIHSRSYYQFEMNGSKASLVNLSDRLVLPAVCKSLYTGMNFGISMGFTHCHFVVGDIIFEEEDLSEILKIEREVVENSKFGYFETVPDNHHFEGIESVYWFCDCKWFLKKFLDSFSYENIIRSVSSDHYLELFIYNKLMDKISDVIIYKKKSGDGLISFSQNKRSGLSVNGGYLNSLISLIYCRDSKTWAIFIDNRGKEVSNLEIFIKTREYGDSFEMIVDPYHWSYRFLNVDEENYINLKVLSSSKKIIDISFDSEMLKNLKEMSSLKA